MLEFVFSLPHSFLIPFLFVLGSLFGSFANVLIYRLQKEEPLRLFNRSYCPHCTYTIPFYLNVPLFSWFFLKGKCRNCKAPFSIRYPLVEFLTASVFALLFFYIGWKWFLLEALVFAFGLIVVSFIDLDQMILPDSFTLSGIVIGLLGGWLNPERSFYEAFLGALLGGFIFWFIARMYFWIRKQEGMGGGDIKLAAWIGAVLGWQSLPFVILSASFSGMLIGLLLIALKRQRFDMPLPFGPFLSLSALASIFLMDKDLFFLKLFFPFAVF